MSPIGAISRIFRFRKFLKSILIGVFSFRASTSGEFEIYTIFSRDCLTIDSSNYDYSTNDLLFRY